MGLLIAALVLCGCCDRKTSAATVPQRSRSAPAKEKRVPKNALATVNGTPITEADVSLAMRGGAHVGTASVQRRRRVLDTLVKKELLAQRAAALGLTRDEQYQRKLRKLEAKVAAFRRQALADLYFSEAIERKVQVSDEEAKKYFAAHEERIRTEHHVAQILLRDVGRIEKALARIRGGESFEAVARAQFSQLPAGSKPWDLGYLKWRQVPEVWRAHLSSLKKGETSGIIRGPNRRFWIIKLVDKRRNNGLTFEAIKEPLVAGIKSDKIRTLRQKTMGKLRRGARVVYRR